MRSTTTRMPKKQTYCCKTPRKAYRTSPMPNYSRTNTHGVKEDQETSKPILVSHLGNIPQPNVKDSTQRTHAQTNFRPKPSSPPPPPPPWTAPQQDLAQHQNPQAPAVSTKRHRSPQHPTQTLPNTTHTLDSLNSLHKHVSDTYRNSNLFILCKIHAIK